MRPGNREHVSHVAMHTPHTPLHLGRPARVQRYSSSMHRAMEEDSLMIRHDDDDCSNCIECNKCTTAVTTIPCTHSYWVLVLTNINLNYNILYAYGCYNIYNKSFL